MKRKTLLLFTTIAIIFLVSCQKTNLPKEEEWGAELHQCTDKKIDPYICFDSLIQDSRCPTGAECFWQGTAIIKVTFTEAGNRHQFEMSLKDFPSLGYPSDTTIGGYRIAFTDLKPYPGITGPKTPYKKAFFSISR